MTSVSRIRNVLGNNVKQGIDLVYPPQVVGVASSGPSFVKSDQFDRWVKNQIGKARGPFN